MLDFGLAKLRDVEELNQVTARGSLVGTPFYMSPEQIRAEDLDARSDLYCLGALIYRMLTGEHPFTGADAGGGADAAPDRGAGAAVEAAARAAHRRRWSTDHRDARWPRRARIASRRPTSCARRSTTRRTSRRRSLTVDVAADAPRETTARDGSTGTRARPGAGPQLQREDIDHYEHGAASAVAGSALLALPLLLALGARRRSPSCAAPTRPSAADVESRAQQLAVGRPT